MGRRRPSGGLCSVEATSRWRRRRRYNNNRESATFRVVRLPHHPYSGVRACLVTRQSVQFRCTTLVLGPCDRASGRTPLLVLLSVSGEGRRWSISTLGVVPEEGPLYLRKELGRHGPYECWGHLTPSERRQSLSSRIRSGWDPRETPEGSRKVPGEPLRTHPSHRGLSPTTHTSESRRGSRHPTKKYASPFETILLVHYEPLLPHPLPSPGVDGSSRVGLGRPSQV